MARDPVSAPSRGDPLYLRPWLLIGAGLAVMALGWLLGAAWPGAPALLRLLLLFAGLAVVAFGVIVRFRQQQWAPIERIETAAMLAAAGLGCLAGYYGMGSWQEIDGKWSLVDDWGSGRLLFGALFIVALLGVVLVLLPPIGRRLVLSLFVLYHFGGMAVAVTQVDPPNNTGPWVSKQLWVHLYRPYLSFLYLTNAYHFYSPDPGPASLFWFAATYEYERPRYKITEGTLAALRSARVPDPVFKKLEAYKDREFERADFEKTLAAALGKDDVMRYQDLVLYHAEETGRTYRWIKLPDRSTSPVYMHYQRLLALPEHTFSPNNRLPYTRVELDLLRERKQDLGSQAIRGSWEDIVLRRQVGSTRNYIYLTEEDGKTVQRHLPIPMVLGVADNNQYREPHDVSKKLIGTVARRIFLTAPQSLPDGTILKSVKVYRVTHSILTPHELARGINPLQKTKYWPFFMGEFDRDGNLVDSLDPFLYWYLPISYVPNTYPDHAAAPTTYPIIAVAEQPEKETFLLDCLEMHAAGPVRVKKKEKDR